MIMTPLPNTSTTTITPPRNCTYHPRHSFHPLPSPAEHTKWNCVLEGPQSCTLPFKPSMRPSVELHLYLWWTLNSLRTKVSDVTKAGVFAPSHTILMCFFPHKRPALLKPPHASKCQQGHEVASGARAEVASGGSAAGV